MAITISCKGDLQNNFDCCAGGTNSTLEKGLLINDAGNEVLIGIPFFVFEGTSSVLVSDTKGNRKVIPLAETSYGSIREISKNLAKCRRPTFVQFFPAPLADVLEITENDGTLPADKDLIWIETENGQPISPQYWSIENNEGANDRIVFTYDQPDLWGIYVKFGF